MFNVSLAFKVADILAEARTYMYHAGREGAYLDPMKELANRLASLMETESHQSLGFCDTCDGKGPACYSCPDCNATGYNIWDKKLFLKQANRAQRKKPVGSS